MSKLYKHEETSELLDREFDNIYNALNILTNGLGEIKVGEVTASLQPSCSVYLNSEQSNVTDATWTKVLLDTETYDVLGEFASNRYTVTKAGYYLVSGQILWAGVGDGKLPRCAIYKNGTSVAMGRIGNPASVWTVVSATTILLLAVDDYIELYGQHNNGDNAPDMKAGSDDTFMVVHKLN